MNILVTGASGFIGQRLVEELSTDNSVAIVYAITRKASPAVSKNIIQINCDLSSSNFEAYLPENIDIVIHLAQSKEYKNFPEKAMDIFSINIASTQILLDWSRRIRIKHFIYASSGNVYGQKPKPLDEHSECLPADYYGKSKYIAETLVSAYSSFFNTTILRIFGVYGPGQSTMIISNLIDKVINRQEITLADGKGLVFTPLYITDCIEMLKTIISKSSKSDIYNLSGNEVITLGEIVSMISKVTSIDACVKTTTGEPVCFIGVSKKFIDKFSYHFIMPFISGLELTIKYKIEQTTQTNLL